MTAYSGQDILKEQDRLAQLRQREEPAWRDIASLIDLDGQDFNVNERHDQPDLNVFDSTPLYALDDYVGGLFGESMNPAERWMELTIEDKDLAKWGPVKKWFWDQATQLYASMSPATSTFYSEASPWIANMGRYGNGFMYQEEWPERQTIIDRSVPIGECFIDVDIAGNLNRFHRNFMLSGTQMRQKFGDAAGGAQEDKHYSVVHAVYPNPDFKRGMLGDRGKPFASTYLSADLQNFRRDGGYYELPYHALFWNRRSGRAWATGPAHIARPDMNMGNEMARSELVAAQFAAEPPILTHDDAVIVAEDIVPNAVLNGTMSQQGKQLLQYLQRGDNPQFAEKKIEERRAAIREAFLYGTMQIMRNRPQMTATEVMALKSERLKLVAPYLVRIQQGLASQVARRFSILSRAGQTIPPPPELRGRPLAVQFVSPLAKAQEAATGSAVLQWITALGNIATAAQRPDVMDKVNLDASADVLHGAMVKLPDVINDDDTVAKIRAQRAQQLAAQQQVEQASKLAGVYADVAHANQAQTRSAQRNVQ